MSRHIGYSDHDTAPPLTRYVTLADADRRAMRSFVRGVVIGAALAALAFAAI